MPSRLAAAFGPAAIAISATAVNAQIAGVYDVASVETAPALEASFDDPSWGRSGVLSGGLHLPWEDVAAPETRFRTVSDKDNFYFAFDVTDPDVIALDAPIGERETIDAEDRVELFFAPGPIDRPMDGKLPPYYAVEVDALGRVHDYSMVYYRNIDSGWTMDGFEAKGAKTATGYTVSGRIPLATLRSLDLFAEDGSMQTGVYRAEFSGDPAKPDMHWISWINPGTAEPDFHVNESFGAFRFVGER